ncbi:hypothetical protein GGU10DRAFT_382249 [Lentinula aff. detonsa]|uniref:Uncharacterized protein n=1 Tax=Lentinula aff. detonsa TaxID=2804958 RepID=A0AA38KCQ0_9AGAR|nr:hypothetical protein GGU10DRAFT_382249 [Lentinula aff. detonsa]
MRVSRQIKQLTWTIADGGSGIWLISTKADRFLHRPPLMTIINMKKYARLLKFIELKPKESESYSMNPNENTTATKQLRASTPPPLASVQSPEILARPETASSATFRTDPKLLDKVNESVSGLPEFIGEISVDDYFKHVLPPLPSHLENKVGEHL